MPKPCPSEVAERAIRSIKIRYVEYLKRIGEIGASRRVGRVARNAPLQVYNRETLAAMVGYVEVFTGDLLIAKRPHVTYDEVFSWPKRKAAWTKHAGVDLARDCKTFELFDGFITARNAIVHNDGHLTGQQLRWNLKSGQEGDVVATLKNAGIEAFGSKLVITPDAVANCVSYGVGFVQELDCLV